MSDDRTDRLALPLLAAGQAQKELYHNEALALLDLAVQANVISAGVDVPPSDPAPGDCWIVGDTPAGDWTGQAGALAGWTGGGWRFVAARAGMRVWVEDVGAFAVFAGNGWTTAENRGRLVVDGVQVVGAQQPAIADPAGGASIDAEARAGVAAILATLRIHGLISAG